MMFAQGGFMRDSSACPALDMSTPESEVRTTTMQNRVVVSSARWVVCLVVVLVAAQLVAGSSPHAAGATGALRVTKAAQSPEPTPLITTYAPGRLILTDDDDPTDPYMLKLGGLYYLYTSEGTTFLNVPLWIGTKPGKWARLVDALPTLLYRIQQSLPSAPAIPSSSLRVSMPRVKRSATLRNSRTLPGQAWAIN